MNILELLATLNTKDVQLALKGEQLSVNGNKQALSDPSILAALREHKPALIELIACCRLSILAIEVAWFSSCASCSFRMSPRKVSVVLID